VSPRSYPQKLQNTETSAIQEGEYLFNVQTSAVMDWGAPRDMGAFKIVRKVIVKEDEPTPNT